jgi:serine/threonine protein kinase/tetratricopeptide (TPR) repeat protein
VDCPSCGQTNAPDRVECARCDALLVDVFALGNEEQTDPIGGAVKTPGSDTGDGFTRIPPDVQYSGDLPRLFRFGNRYQVLEKLGEGGMGRVYKALDLELDRPVALKTIRTEKGRGPEVLKRFKQELILARKITHKNVVRIYDLGEAEGGLKFFTMELVEGKSLRDLLREKKIIPVKEAISFLKQILSGLSEAHSQGVIHRDLKPQNVMLDKEGLIRIMDFGIARTSDTTTLTGSGEMMGTPDYISPEQVKGDSTTAQSDLYSTGIILYELLTGEVPFKGDTALSKVVARLQVKPTAPRALNPQIPPYLERIILKLMEVDTDLRYKTADEVLQDIEREQVHGSLLLRTKKALLRRKGWIAAGVLGSLGLGGWLLWRNPNGEVQADVPVTTIAILPFHNMTGNAELEWMENGLPEMLITDMSQSSALRPILAERIRRILKELGQEKQTRFDEQSIQVVSEMSQVDFALSGSFVESEGRLRVDLSLKSSKRGLETPIKVEGSSAAVFSLVDEITTEVSGALALDPIRESDRPIADVSTSSLEAFRAYHQGLQELQKGANQTAISFLEKAIRLDPQFAMAHARLAEAHYNLNNSAVARQVIQRANTAAEALPLAERYQIHAIASRIEDDPAGAVASYRELAQLYPDDPNILLSLASSLETLGSVDEASEQYSKVLERAPQYGAAVLGLGRMLVLSGRNEKAVSVLTEALESERFAEEPETLGMIHSILGVVHRDSGQTTKAIEHLEKSLEYRRQAGDERGTIASLTNLAVFHIRQGDLNSAKPLLEDGLQLAQGSANWTMESFALVNLATLHERAGERDLALDVARQSLEIEWERKEHTELADRLNYTGHLYTTLGRYADAMVYLEQAKVHIAVSGEPSEKGNNELYRGHVFIAKGLFDDAVKAFLLAVSFFREANDVDGAAWALNSLSAVYLSQGRLRDAQATIEEARALSAKVIPAWAATTHLNEARLQLQLGDPASSELSLKNADEILRRMKSTDLRGFYHLVAGELAWVRGESEEARQHWVHSMRAKDRDHLQIGLESRVKLAEAERASTDLSSALDLADAAWKDSHRLRLPVQQAYAALVLSKIYFDQNRLDQSRENLSRAISLAESFGGRPMLLEEYRLSATISEREGHADQAREAQAHAAEVELWLREQLPEDRLQTEER